MFVFARRGCFLGPAHTFFFKRGGRPNVAPPPRGEGPPFGGGFAALLGRNPPFFPLKKKGGYFVPGKTNTRVETGGVFFGSNNHASFPAAKKKGFSPREAPLDFSPEKKGPPPVKRVDPQELIGRPQFTAGISEARPEK